MMRRRLLLATAMALFVGLAGIPAEAGPPGVLSSAAASASVPTVIAAPPTIQVPTDAAHRCDPPMPAPFRSDMSRFTVRGTCFYRTWRLVGWVEPGDSARGLLVGWRSNLRTARYRTNGRIGCAWSGATQTCSQTLEMTTGLAYGALITRVGPIEDNGTRDAMVKVWVGYGG